MKFFTVSVSTCLYLLGINTFWSMGLLLNKVTSLYTQLSYRKLFYQWAFLDLGLYYPNIIVKLIYGKFNYIPSQASASWCNMYLQILLLHGVTCTYKRRYLLFYLPLVSLKRAITLVRQHWVSRYIFN